MVLNQTGFDGLFGESRNCSSCSPSDSETADSNITDDTNHAKCIDDPEWEPINRFLLVGLSTIFLVTGLFGNTMAFWVLQQKAYKNNVMAAALRYLTIVDNINILLGPLEITINIGFGHDILSTSYEACSIHYYTNTIFMALDAWILVFIISARYVHVRYPFQSHRMCYRLNYYAIFTLAHVVVIAGNVWCFLSVFALMPKGVEIEAYNSCYSALTYYESVVKGLKTFKVAINTIIPLIVVFVVSMLTYGELKQIQLRRKGLFGGPKSSTNENTTTNALPFSEAAHLLLSKMKQRRDHRKSSAVFTISDKQSNITDLDRALLNQRDGGSSVDTGVSRNSRNDVVELGAINTSKVTVSLQPVKARRESKTLWDMARRKSLAAKRDEAGSSASTGASARTDNRSIVSKISSALKEPVSFGPVVASDIRTFNTESNRLDGNKTGDFQANLNSTSARMNQMTRLLIGSSFIYLFTNIPNMMSQLYLSKYIYSNIRGCNLQEFMVYVMFLLKLSNYSVNFYFYCVISTQFRQELVKLLRRFECRSSNAEIRV